MGDVKMFFKCSYKIKIIISYVFILSIVQSKKPDSQRLLATWRLECELGIIIDPECPVDGGWSHWAPWSTCIGACDGVGRRKRRRECNNPLPTKDGVPCIGTDEQSEFCYLKNCSVYDYRRIVEGDFTRTEALRQLEAVPVLMEHCLQMECPYEAVEAALATENIWQLSPEILWNALQCVKHDLGCSLNGEWGAWGLWSVCGARCGKGLRWRSRRCDTPPPSAHNLVCLGIPLQSQECEGDQCAIDGQYTELGVSGTWSEWGVWTNCSERCGTGVRRRNRTCIEKHISLSARTWRTHCRGQHNEFEICDIKKCLLDGGWSGWGAWGQCSQTCGAGKRSRTRSCTRPIPAGGGANCIGNKVDADSCHLTPCEVYNHLIAIFNGDSVLQYDFNRKFSTFIHIYIRFLALSPHGTLIRRGILSNPTLRVSLHKWHICIDANGSSKTCSLPRTCSPLPLDTSIWHSIMVSVTNEGVTIRIDDAPTPLYSPFPCDPELTNYEMNVILGERFHGEIQEFLLNFIPISIFIDREHRTSKADLFPALSAGMAYEKASKEEAFINLENEYYLLLPCFEVQHEWRLELTFKSTKESGTILFLSNNNNSDWFYIILDNMRIKIKFSSYEYKSEASSSTECLPDQWLDIKVNKIKETNTIEVIINSAERLHILLTENSFTKRKRSNNKDSKYIQNTSAYSNYLKDCKDYINRTEQIILCSNEYFIGGVPATLKNEIPEDIPPFFGTIASLKVNNELLDLYKINMERYKDKAIQLSSRSTSISESYHETSWGGSNKLNLTCVYTRISGSSLAFWLYLDTEIENKNVCSFDNGKISRLSLSANIDRPGFYTCRTNVNSRTRNTVTYGVLGKNHHNIMYPDTITILAFITTLCLVIFTLGWLIIEGYNDACDGYGFFRDDQPTPEKRQENENEHENEYPENIRNIAKVSARRRCRRLSSQLRMDNQTILKLDNERRISNDYTYSKPEELVALPEFKSAVTNSVHQEIYRCEPSYISSPLHDSKMSSSKTRLSSSSLNSSPRKMCLRLLLNKYKSTSKDKKIKSTSCKYKLEPEKKTKLLTIKSLTFNKNPSVQKVLQKFYNLKSTDS